MAFSIKVPRIGTLKAETTEELGELLWQECHGGQDHDKPMLGSSKVGSTFNCLHDGKVVGRISYNGRFWPNESGVT